MSALPTCWQLRCTWAQNGLLLGIPIVFDTDREDINVGDKVLITYK
jgi:hypothetical protein